MKQPFVTSSGLRCVGSAALRAALCGLLYALSLGHSAHAEIIGLESFDYPDGPVAGQNSGVGWLFENLSPVTLHGPPADWDATAGAPVVSSGQLRTLSGQTARREYNGPGEGLPDTTDEGRGAINGSRAAKVVYYRVHMTRADGALESSITSLDFGFPRVRFGVLQSAQGLRFGVIAPDQGATGASFSSKAVAVGQDYTLVTKIDFANRVAALYLDPDLNLLEPAVPDAQFTYTQTHWSTALQLSSTGGRCHHLG